MASCTRPNGDKELFTLMTTDLQLALYAALPTLFEIDLAPMPDGSQRVVTPFMLHDGTMVQIYVAERDGKFVLVDGSDLGGWLWQLSGGKELSPRQLYLLDQICRRDLGMAAGYPGELALHCDRPEDLAAAVFRLGQAMLRVSDLWFLDPYSTAGMKYNAADDKSAAPPAQGIAV